MSIVRTGAHVAVGFFFHGVVFVAWGSNYEHPHLYTLNFAYLRFHFLPLFIFIHSPSTCVQRVRAYA